MATKKEIARRLGDINLFGRCTKSDLKIIARHVETISVESGRMIVRAGDDGDAMFVIMSGAAAVERDGHHVADLGEGDYFGELALLDPAPRAATVRATSDCELAVLGVRMFRVLLRDLPGISAKLLADLAARVRQAGEVTEH